MAADAMGERERASRARATAAAAPPARAAAPAHRFPGLAAIPENENGEPDRFPGLRRHVNLPLAVAPDAPHVAGQLTVNDIPLILDIHRGRTLVQLRRKVPQQHKHNCWADSSMALFFQSDPLNENTIELLTICFNYYINRHRGRINDRFYDLDKIRGLAREIQDGYPGTFGARPVILTYNIMRYMRKLFQIYEQTIGIGGAAYEDRAPAECPEELGGPVPPIASAQRAAANAVQEALRPGRRGGNFTDMNDITALAGRLVPGLTAALLNPRINPRRITGYYIATKRIGQHNGHAISLFKINTLWYLYNNDNNLLIHGYNQEQSNALTNNLISGMTIRYRATSSGENDLYEILLSDRTIVRLSFGNNNWTADHTLWPEKTHVFYRN
jgi:hypothetical protein